MNVNRNLIIPIAALIALYCKSVAGIDIPDDTANIITDAALSILALIGIFTNPKKKEDDSDGN